MIDHESLPLLPPPGLAPTQPRSVPRTVPVPAREDIRRGDWVLVENLGRIRDERDRRSTPVGGIETIPAALGGETLVALVAAGADARVPHSLGRVPQAIAYVQPGRPGDLLVGSPAGGGAASGSNASAWDNRFLYVRSNVAPPGRLFTFTVT